MNEIEVCIVIPWFGRDLKGGAEQLAWQLANRLSDRGVGVTILTTCVKTFLADWSINYYKEGTTTENGLVIKRFEVVKRNTGRFSSVNQKLISIKQGGLIAGISPVIESEESIFLKENIYSPELSHYISDNKDNYHSFIFLPYLFPNIIEGVSLVKEKAILQPCLHNEAYAYLDSIVKMHFDAKRIFFNSLGEYELAKQILGPSIINRSKIVYSGVESLNFEKIEYKRFLLYLGRRDEGKNTHLLIDSFDQFIKETNSDLQLLIAGVGDLPIVPLSKNIIDLGLISEEKKCDLLASCLALINPSKNESFSRVIYESWYAAKPVIVHTSCLATYLALEESGMAGFSAETLQEFIVVYKEIDNLDIGVLKDLGEKGRKYAKNVADWDQVVDRYLLEFESMADVKQEISINDKAVYQLLPGFDSGDAVSNQAIAIDQELKKMGYKSEIFAQYIDKKVEHIAKKFDPKKLTEKDILLYHHSIGFDYTKDAVAFKGKKALIYHNITPKDFFEPYDSEFSLLLKQGRESLNKLATSFPKSFADSQFNADELELNNFANPEILPLIIDPDRWNFLPDPEIVKMLSDGKKNILFTGRMAPNKKQTDLIKMIPSLLAINPDVRLCLVGHDFNMSFPYVREVHKLIDKLNLKENIWISGKVNENELKACFMCADLYFSASEHEGFGVPLIEAMWFDIPVLAYKSTAIPETLSSAAFMIDDKKDVEYIAILVNLLLQDEEIRSKMILEQRKVRERYSLKQLQPVYRELIKELLDD